MNTTLLCTVLGLSIALPAQDNDAQKDRLQESQSEVALEQFESLEAEVEKAYGEYVAAFRKRMAEAEEKGENPPAFEYSGFVKPFVPRFMAAAEQYQGSEDAVQFLVWIATSGIDADKDAGTRAYSLLFENHIESEGLEGIASNFPQLGEILDKATAATWLAKVERLNPHKKIKAWAAYARLFPILDSAPIDSAEFKAASAEINRFLEGVKDRHLVGEVGAKINLRTTFAMGMVAPDIEGIDLDGAAFKLSDYKGKVLFVDFWGDW